ncbi:type II secretion system protein N [Psychrobacter sp.]|uniref:type II secretion system protein N n=1 Tax=Psychrobacter sp. TaxID=56811 RepID=UPI002647B011|nr:type II secretion system protein N [Psychrobacter sp.]MDN6276817.1 PDZ domain-containing protein [Psychrobacter sp.]MDN6308741.1 PDZ domain-containing protein [Psychrobacter sp.]
MLNIGANLKPVINTLNRFSGWVLLLAIAWLCWTAARLLWLLLAAPLAPTLPLVPLQSSADSGNEGSGLFAVFADPDPAATAVKPPPNVELKGVLMAMPESMSSALLSVDGTVKNYRIGDSLKESGYTLVAVDWDAAIIADASGKQSVIRMPEAMPLDQSDMMPNEVSNQRLPNNNTLPTTAPAPTSMDNSESEASGSSPQSAIEDAVNELQENPASYLSRMGVMASGESYQVTAAMPANIRNRLGLEPGDKVLTVNGQNVGSDPAQDAGLLQQVQQTGEAQIEVQRGEQIITIRQQF